MLKEFKSKVSETKIKPIAIIEFFLLWFLYLIGWITLIGITFNNIKITDFNGGFDVIIEASGAVPVIEKCMSLLYSWRFVYWIRESYP